MHITATPQRLLSIDPETRTDVLRIQMQRAQAYILHSQARIDETLFPSIRSVIHEHSRVDLDDDDLRIFFRLFPYSAAQVAHYGINDSETVISILHDLSHFLVGTDFLDDENFKLLMVSQAEKIFTNADRRERLRISPDVESLIRPN